MKKSILMLLVVCAVFALSNCKKDYLVQNTGTVTGNVRDVANNNYLGKVLATVVIDKNTMLKDSTDSVGYFSISGIPVGTYALVYSKAGYATMRTSVTVENSDAVTNTTSGSKQTENYGLFQSVQMYPLVSKAKGTVTLFGVPIANAIVTAYVRPGSAVKASSVASITPEFEPYYYTTTSDANGVYSFSNLPLFANTTVVATSGSSSATSGSFLLGLTSTVTPLAVSNINMTDNELLLLNYTGKGGVLVDTASQITLTFSENISADITKSLGGYVKLFKGADEVLTTVSYSNNQITISPISPATLTRNTTYYIDVEVYATAFKSILIGDGVSASFTTKAPSATLTTPSITYDAINGLRITIASIATKANKGTISYELWAKGADEADFVKSATSIADNVTAPYSIASVAKYSYYVVAQVTGFDGAVVRTISNIVTRP
jgi:hypothetical protein